MTIHSSDHDFIAKLNAFVRYNGRGSNNAANATMADIVQMLLVRIKALEGDTTPLSFPPEEHAPAKHVPKVATDKGVLDVLEPSDALAQWSAAVAGLPQQHGEMVDMEHPATITVTGEHVPMIVVSGHESDVPVVEHALFPDPAAEPAGAVEVTHIGVGDAERQVVNIDVGDMPAEKAHEAVEAAKEEIQAQRGDDDDSAAKPGRKPTRKAGKPDGE